VWSKTSLLAILPATKGRNRQTSGRSESHFGCDTIRKYGFGIARTDFDLARRGSTREPVVGEHHVRVGEGKGNVRHRPVLVLADLKDSGGERAVLVPRQLSNLCP